MKKKLAPIPEYKVSFDAVNADSIVVPVISTLRVISMGIVATAVATAIGAVAIVFLPFFSNRLLPISGLELSLCQTTWGPLYQPVRCTG
jgi:hypothetical protein